MRNVFRQFTEFDQYETTIRGAQMTGYVAERGAFKAKLQQLELGRLWMQRGHERLPRSAHVNIPADRNPVFFLDPRMEASVWHSGQEIKPGQLVFWGEAASHYQKTQSEMRWAAMSLSPADLAVVARHLTGAEITAPKVTQIVDVEPGAMARLAMLHETATRLANEAPEKLCHPEVERAISQTLIEAMINCLRPAPTAAFDRGWHQHWRIMRRFEEWLKSNLGRPVYLADACAALGVSQRTLNSCCRAHVGTSPSRYLWLRRMHQANRALLYASAEHTTVAQIAMEFGFWELGRFSVNHRRLFGESPKLTLRR